MKSRIRRSVLALGLGPALLVPHLIAGTAKAQPPPPSIFSYQVKYLCSHLDPFPTIFHWTDVNILNPSKSQRAEVRKKFVVSGTEKLPTSVKPVIDQFQLGPNQAASIDCDDIQTHFNVPLSTAMEGFVEIESPVRLTVTAVYDKCVTQQRVDIFRTSQARLSLQLDGILPQPQPITLQGPAVVRKGDLQIDAQNHRFVQRTELVSMDLAGTVALPDRRSLPIHLIISPKFQSEGQIVGEVDAATLAPVFPARSYFDVFFEIVSSDPAFQEKIGRAFNVDPVRLEAAITAIPPGRPAKTVTRGAEADRLRRLFPEGRLEEAAGGFRLVLPGNGEAAAAFADDVNEYCAPKPATIFSARSGAQIGQVSNHCHGPNPPAPEPPKHSPVICADASIDVQYITPTSLQR